MQSVFIENQVFKVEINPLGAELRSLIDKRDETEHMWEADPKFWPRKAPILFPCVGESKDGLITIEGTQYPMGRHGFTRNQLFEVVGLTGESVVFEFKQNAETLAHYPFNFTFRITYSLDGQSLIHHFEVVNTGDETLGFQLGGHPAFAVPFDRSEAYSDYQVCFNQNMTLDRHLLNAKGLYNGKTRNVLDDSNTIELNYELFNEDALVFKEIPSKSVWIENKNGGKSLRVDYEGFPHLGIWSKSGADYVCIEPWIGCADHEDQPDDFFEKDSVVLLKPKETFKASFSVSLINQ